MKKITILTIAIAITIAFTAPVFAMPKGIGNQNCITSKKLATAYAKANYKGCKIKFIGQVDTKKEWYKIEHRKGKKIVYIEKCVSKSSGKKYGYTIKGHYYIAYNKKVKKGKKVTSYFIYNPYNNHCDGIDAAVDNKMIR